MAGRVGRINAGWRVAAACLIAALLLFVWGFVVEPAILVTTTVTVVSKQWPPGRAPARVVAISDLHIGAPHMKLDKLAAVVRRIDALKPDVVLLLGDFVIHGVLFGKFVDPETIASGLRPLASRYPVYSVLGNHDWWLDGARMRSALEGAGIRVLENESAALALPEGRLWLAGIADDTTRKPNLVRALRSVPKGEPVIVFAHDPAIFPDVPVRAVMTLAGHMHGGQVYLPWVGALITPGRAPRRHAHGLIREDGKTMVVTGGVGTSIIPVRFNMPPEIMLIELKSVAAAPVGK
jgi:predicted MPP superfamily phosphohydrolase